MIYLASASPRRHALMRYLNIPFEIVSVEVEESLSHTTDGLLAAYDNAKIKAQAAFKKLEKLVLGCDTVVQCGNRLMGKPTDAEEAYRMLKTLSGRTHTVTSACVLITQNQEYRLHGQAQVTFYSLTDVMIYSYIDTEEPFGKAGAYGIQGEAIKFVQKIEGDYASIMGLPVGALAQFFTETLTLK